MRAADPAHQLDAVIRAQGEVNDGQRYYRLRYTGMGKPANPGYSKVTDR